MGSGTGHLAERMGQSRANGEDAEHLEKICDRRRILERMRTVGIEESTTVSTPFLDDFLRGNRALCDGLRGNGIHYRLALAVHRGPAVGADALHLLRFDQLDHVVRLQVLNDTLRHKEKGTDYAEWQKNPETATNEVNPE